MAAETMATQEIFKKVYLDPVTKAVPESNVFQRKIKFDSRNKVGDSYVGAVQLRRPNGFTFWGGTARGTAATLNGALAGVTKQVTVKPSSIMLQEQVAYDVAAAATAEGAFDPQMALITQSMVESVNWAWELQNAYGGTNIGISNANSGAASPTGVFQMSKASWSAQIWGPFEGGQVDAYSDAALTTKVTSDGPAVVGAVDIDNRNVTLTFASGANYTAAAAATATGLYLVPYAAAGTAGWVDGVASIISKSAAGSTVFDVNTSLYAYMRASSLTQSGALTFSKVAESTINPAVKGGMGDYDVVVAPYAWVDIMNDEAGLRRYQSDNGGEFRNGANELVYYGPNGGTLTFTMDPIIKAGEAYILMFEDWRNVGASEPTFELPHRDPGNPMFLREMETVAAYELRRYANFGTYCQRLARQAVITGFTNASGPSGGGT